MGQITKPYVGDVGTEIILDCKVDISSATIKQIKCRKPNGTEVSWNATLLGRIFNLSIVSGGSGYNVGDILLLSQGLSGVGAIVKVKTVSGSAITSISIEDSGNGYQANLPVEISGGAGSGAEFLVTEVKGTMLKYVVQQGDFDQPGIYNLQAYVVLPEWKGLGETVSFEVFDRFE